MIAFLLALALTTPFDTEVHEHVDLIEHNSYFDEKAAHVYDQVIFYRWDEPARKFHVRAWVLIEPKSEFARRPFETPHDGRVHVRWYDSDQKLYRHMSSDSFKRTQTQVDPERANKEILDESDRISLIRKDDIDRPEVNPVVDDHVIQEGLE